MSGDPASYFLSIDWFNVGGFPDNGDTSKLRWYKSSRGRQSSFVGDVRTNEAKLARNRIGTLDLILDNEDGRYDAYNRQSALFPNVTQGKIVQLRVTDDLGVTYTLFTGIVDDIRTIGYRHDARVKITCTDAWKILSQMPMSTSLYQNDTVASPMVEMLSNIAGIGGLLGTGIQNGSDVLPYIWGDEDTPFNVLHELTEIDGGYCFIDVLGFFRFICRLAAQAVTPVFLIDQSQCLDEPQLTQPWDNVVNCVEVGIHNRILSTEPGILIWGDPSVVALQPNESVSYIAMFSGVNGQPCPAILEGGSISAYFNTQPDGTGTPLALYIEYFSPPNQGVGTGILFRNISNQVGYLCRRGRVAIDPPAEGPGIFAFPLDDSSPTKIVVKDAVSIANFQQRTLRLDSKYMQGAVNAKNVGNYYLARFKDGHATITIQIQNRSTLQFGYDLNTLMNFTSVYLVQQNLAPRVSGGISSTSAAIAGQKSVVALINPGFETGDAIGWKGIDNVVAPPNAPVHEQVQSVTKLSGTYANHFWVDMIEATVPAAGSWWRWLIRRPVVVGHTLTVTTPYNLTVSGGFTSFSAEIRFYDANGQQISFTQIFTTAVSSAGWVSPSSDVVVPANAATADIVYICSYPGTLTRVDAYIDDVSIVDGSPSPWLSPSNALIQDSITTSVQCSSQPGLGITSYTEALKITGLTFDPFPSTSTIVGVQVRIRKRGTVLPRPLVGYEGTAGVKDLVVKLIKGGTISGDNKAQTSVIWSTYFTDYVYGGRNDLWGLTLLYSDIGPTFGVAIQASCGLASPESGWGLAEIDFVEFTIYAQNGAFANAFRIIDIAHECGDTPFGVRTTWVLEPATNSSGLPASGQTYPTPSAGELQVGMITY